MWTLLWNLWDDRNRILHDSQKENSLLSSETLRSEAVEEFEKGTTLWMTRDEKSLWKCTVDSLVKRSAPQIRSWLERLERHVLYPFIGKRQHLSVKNVFLYAHGSIGNKTRVQLFVYFQLLFTLYIIHYFNIFYSYRLPDLYDLRIEQTVAKKPFRQ